MGLRLPVHHRWEYFTHAATFIRGTGIQRIHVTGGEPTTHPQFAEFIPKFKELFGVPILTLQTDGFKTGFFKEVLTNFDHIYASRYDERNAKSVDVLVSDFNATVWSGAFTPRSQIGPGGVCQRGKSETVAYADGKFWPCCVAPGIVGAPYLEPCVDWKTKIEAEQVPLACKDCWFSI